MRRAAKLAEASGMAAEVVKAANDAAAVRIEAQAKAGEILREMKDAGQRAVSGGSIRKESQPVILRDLDVTPMQSSRWQHVAAIPEPVRQEYVSIENRSHLATDTYSPTPNAVALPVLLEYRRHPLA